MILSMVLALAAAATGPTQGYLDRALVSPGVVLRLDKDGKPIPQYVPPRTPPAEACTAHNVQQAAEQPGVLYKPGQPNQRGLTPLGQLPDANLIHAVLRVVDGRCQIEVVRYNVSQDPAKAAAPVKSKTGR